MILLPDQENEDSSAFFSRSYFLLVNTIKMVLDISFTDVFLSFLKGTNFVSLVEYSRLPCNSQVQTT